MSEPAPSHAVAETVRRLHAPEAAARMHELADLLVDAVAHGASVNFLAGLEPTRARQFWEGTQPGLQSGATQLFVAERDGRMIGTALLFLAQQPNQPHRGDVGKMLVHSGERRRGVGRRLLAAAEAAAVLQGRTLLMLDTTSGSAGDALYRAQGWTDYGRVPGHALDPAGLPTETTFFFKRL